MKAMAVTQFGEPLEMIDLADPVPGYGELVLSVDACAICASDLKLIAGHSPKEMKVDLPAVPGHEIVGSVSALGPGVADWQMGDRGVVYVYVACGQCNQCLSGNERRCRSLRYHIGLGVHGGFAEKIKIPAHNLVKIPDNLSDQAAVVITDAVTTSLHAVVDRAQVTPGDRVLILGAGGIGIHVLQMVLLSGGYAIVVDINDIKLDQARELGAHETFNTSDIRQLAPAMHFNKVIDTTGTLDDWPWIFDHIHPGGLVVMVGYAPEQAMQIMITELITKELAVKGSRGGSLANIFAAIDLVAEGIVKPIIASVAKLEEANAIIDLMKSNDTGAGRHILIP
jgi:2-desacetyl-2-hydroxyethyl bacteriochlorophyllide A dehydrogenase